MTLNQPCIIVLLTLLVGPQSIALAGDVRLSDSTGGPQITLARLNPSCRCLTATLTIHSASNVSLRLCNLLGYEVASWELGLLPPGDNILNRSLPDLASGVYFLVADVDEMMIVKKLLYCR